MKGYKLHLFMYMLILISILGIYSLTIVWPQYEERFFELGLLGRNMMAEDYFVGEGSTVLVDSDIEWFIYVKNTMHSDQNITIRVKLLNSTMQAPNDTRPSPYSPFFELPLSIVHNETLMIPFSWRIIDVEVGHDSIILRQLTVNEGLPIEVTVPSIADNRFRLVFELWVYNPVSHEYEFGWDSDGNYRSASVFMWFNLPIVL